MHELYFAWLCHLFLSQAAALLESLPAETAEVAFQYGKHLGIAFQLVDDLLDFEGSLDSLGKPAMNDLKQVRAWCWHPSACYHTLFGPYGTLPALYMSSHLGRCSLRSYSAILQLCVRASPPLLFCSRRTRTRCCWRRWHESLKPWTTLHGRVSSCKRRAVLSVRGIWHLRTPSGRWMRCRDCRRHSTAPRWRR
jgi:hypothetical protein